MEKNFEEAVGDLIDKYLPAEGYDGIISALELKLMAMREQERETLETLKSTDIKTFGER